MENSVFREKALENISAAELFFDSGKYNASANRAYYAAFQSAIWILLKYGFDVERASHKIVISKFNSEMINRRKIITKKYCNMLHDSLIIRNDADYSRNNISKHKASKLLDNAKNLMLNIYGEI